MEKKIVLVVPVLVVTVVERFILPALHYSSSTMIYINSAVDTSQRWLLGPDALTQRSMIPGAMPILNSQQNTHESVVEVPGKI